MTKKKARWWLESIVRNYGGSVHHEALSVIFAEPNKYKELPSEEKIRAFGVQLLKSLRSDPEYAYRLDHEGSGNW